MNRTLLNVRDTLMTSAWAPLLRRNFPVLPGRKELFAACSIISRQFDACQEASGFDLTYIIQGFASKPAPGLILIRSLNGAQFLDQFQR
jgi:hypothetical protein